MPTEDGWTTIELFYNETSPDTNYASVGFSEDKLMVRAISFFFFKNPKFREWIEEFVLGLDSFSCLLGSKFLTVFCYLRKIPSERSNAII